MEPKEIEERNEERKRKISSVTETYFGLNPSSGCEKPGSEIYF